MWIFYESTGVLEHDGNKFTEGYSGARGLGFNLAETVQYFGPIPRGLYAIGWSFSAKSPQYVLSLTPIGHDAHGRTSFLIHGDYRAHERQGNASEGCIVLPLEARRAIWESTDRLLSVQF